MFYLSSQVIDCSGLTRQLVLDEAGAVVTFEGRVRNHNGGNKVAGLEYESYPELAEAEAQKIFTEVCEKFNILKVSCVHRTGKLILNDVAVWVGVSAAHRDEAFVACRYVIDEIKARLPIWKKEIFVDGRSAWVNGQDSSPGTRPS